MNKKILVSLMVIGITASVAAGSTFALFNDTEESTGNTFTAGAVDLQIDWTETYNGEFVERQELTDNPGPVFEFDDVKPGDEGEATLSFHIDNNPSWLWMSTDLPVNAENDVTEPENDSEEEDNVMGGDFDPDQNGELAQKMNVRLWYDDYEGSEEGAGDNVYQPAEEELIYGGGTQVCEDVGGTLDAALVLDRSGSMDGPNLQEAKDGGRLLVDSLGNNDQSSAVSYAGSATLDQELTTNKTAVKEAINSTSAGGSTDVQAGVDVASEELINGTNARSNATKIMVVLGDGDVNTDGSEAKDAGIRIIAIALDGASSDMEDLASSSDDYYVADDASELEGVFEDISGTICETQGGTLAGLHDQMENGTLLDGDTSTEDEGAFGPDTQYVGFEWWIPREVGNEIQTDSVEFDMNFYAEQERNNPNPENPFAN